MAKSPTDRPRVAIFMDGSRSYARSIVRGIAKYANLQRRWLMYKDFSEQLSVGEEWPNFSGAIFAGVNWDLFNYGVKTIPHVVYCSGNGDPNVCPVISIDDRAAGAQAAEHLLSRQIKHFAFYGYIDWMPIARNRKQGFCDTLRAHGFDHVALPGLLPSPREWTSHTLRPMIISWLKELPKPVGIMTMDDDAAHDLAETCLEAGLAVPDEVAIVGVNNDDLMCETAWPPLSSVNADFSRLGYEAAKTLDRMMAGEQLSESDREMRIPPLGVVQRQSTNMLAISDRNLAEAVRYISEHACDPCTVQDVLRHVPVSRRWLERQFMVQIGRTPHDEITRIRMETAKRYLLQMDLSLTDIVRRCGYAGDTNFHRAFRQSVGMTPAAYRRIALKDTRS